MRSVVCGVLLAGSLAWAVLAWREWTFGVPPLWSVAGARAETVVTHAELVEERRANGHQVQVPHVYVAWPPEEGTDEELAGLRSSHEVWHMHTPAEFVREHPAGSTISVRVVDGHPMANRTDLRDLGYALAASLLAMLFAAGGLALFGRAGGRDETAG
jgi:hypothetical protein